jgi:hypothetical protein
MPITRSQIMVGISKALSHSSAFQRKTVQSTKFLFVKLEEVNIDQKTIYAESSLNVDEVLKRVDYRLILYAVTALAEGKTGMAHSLDH